VVSRAELVSDHRQQQQQLHLQLLLPLLLLLTKAHMPKPQAAQINN